MTSCQTMKCRRKATLQAEDGAVLACESCASLQADYDWKPVTGMEQPELADFNIVGVYGYKGKVIHAVNYQKGLPTLTLCNKITSGKDFRTPEAFYMEHGYTKMCQQCGRKVGVENMVAVANKMCAARNILLKREKEQREKLDSALMETADQLVKLLKTLPIVEAVDKTTYSWSKHRDFTVAPESLGLPSTLNGIELTAKVEIGFEWPEGTYDKRLPAEKLLEIMPTIEEVNVGDQGQD